MYYKNYIYFILNLYNVVDKQKFKSYTYTVNRPTLQSGVIWVLLCIYLHRTYKAIVNDSNSRLPFQIIIVTERAD